MPLGDCVPVFALPSLWDPAEGVIFIMNLVCVWGATSVGQLLICPLRKRLIYLGHLVEVLDVRCKHTDTGV